MDASMVGRRAELDRLAQALDEVTRGSGSLWFLTGEAGIGKTRLAEEAARLSRERGMQTVWGRCWEAGGAPAFWPWVQILRALVPLLDPNRLREPGSPFAQLLPELELSRPPSESYELSPEQARFQLMDAIGRVLMEAGRRSPLLIILEDLHVADVSTVLLLDFLAAVVRNESVLVLGTFREAQLGRSPAGERLARVAQQGHRLALERLTVEEVTAFLQATESDVDRDRAGAVHRVTEGHPLFVAEIARLWRTRGASAAGEAPRIPTSVRQTIETRLEAISPSNALALRRGAAVGREFEIDLLRESFDDDVDYLAACHEGIEHAVLIEVAPGRYRFTHFVVRELVYQATSDDERFDTHLRLATGLRSASQRGEEPLWSEIAHHYASAGPEASAEAASAYLQASRQALRQLAFDEAVAAAERAVACCSSTPSCDERTRAAMLIGLGRARIRAADILGGKTSCAEAASIARSLSDPELLAEAALEHGAALIFAQVDSELVSLLEEALSKLATGDTALRARVMARLAAAKQPSFDPIPPTELAREAIAMARRVGDERTHREALRNGCSALVHIGQPQETLALNREHAALAKSVGNPAESLGAQLRALLDLVQLGRIEEAYLSLDACERAADDLGHPAYRWRCRALRCLRASWEGDFGLAETHLEEAWTLGEQARDPNAKRACDFQRIRLLQLQGAFDAQRSLLDEFAQSWKGTEFGELLADVICGAEHFLVGRREEGVRHFHPQRVEKLTRLGSTIVDVYLARLCAGARHAELCKLLIARLAPKKEQLATTGAIGMTIEGPGSWSLAILCAAVDRSEEARAHYEHALAKASAVGGRAVHAQIACEYAELLAVSASSAELSRAEASAREALAVAEEIGMRNVEERTRALLGTLSPRSQGAAVPSRDPELRLEALGDSWLIRYEGTEFHLKDMKGVRWLAELIGNPGREFHVLELSGVSEADAVDAGDAGEMLDEEARRQYQRRVLELREQIEEAERWNDAGRVEKARSELEFLTKELAVAVGLGGRARRSGAASERARINVQRRIRSAIRRMQSHHPGLAKHLDRTVKTGMYCRYDP